MDRKNLFPIGEVSKLFHISVSSLRHYENIGLLTPEYISPDSGYRYYGTEQFEVLNTIRYLRALDMPLTEIEDFLKNKDIDRIEEKLRQQDSQFAAEAYTALEDYMVTDIASGTAAKIGEKLKQYKQLDTLTIDGENVIENGYWAYHLDESSREATVLQLFYEKVR